MQAQAESRHSSEGGGRAVRLRSFGGPEALEVHQVPAPEAAPARSGYGSPRPA